MKKSIYALVALIILSFSGCSSIHYIQDKQKFNLNEYSIDIDIELEDNTTKESKVDSRVIENRVSKKKPKKVAKEEEIVPDFIKNKMLTTKLGGVTSEFLDDPDKLVRINVENIPLNKFVDAVFGQILKINYTADKAVKKREEKVTMRMEKPLKKEEFFKIAKNILQNYKISLSYENEMLFVKSGGSGKLNKLDYKISIGREIQFKEVPENEIIYQIIPINYISLNEARDTLSRFSISPKIGRNYTFLHYNAIILKDYVKNIKRSLTLLNMIDRPYLKDKKFRLIYLKNIKVDKFYTRIDEIFKTMNIRLRKNITKEPITIAKIPEINAILVITDKKELVNIIEYWKIKLDNLEMLGDKMQMFVYKTKHRKAEEVETILKSLIDSVPATTKSSDEKSKNIKQKKQIKILPKNLKITVDKDRNMLVFYMTPPEYKTISSLLEKIDTPPQQVMIDITIAEVTLVDKLQYGIEWYLKNSIEGKDWVLQTIGNLGVGSGGITGNVISGNSFQALLNAFMQKNLIKVLSSPKLIVLNNKSATFSVGTQVPVITSQSTASDLGADNNGNPTFSQNVTYRATGINISVKPTITANGSLMLSLQISQSEAQTNNTSNISSPIILNRSISTTVILKDAEELMLGGLISKNKSNTETKVPLLGDIPLLGYLFKTASVTETKTELIFLVKPRIITKIDKSKAILKAFKKLTIF